MWEQMILEEIEKYGVRATAEKYGVNKLTVYRWRKNPRRFSKQMKRVQNNLRFIKELLEYNPEPDRIIIMFVE
jgi:DNA invertase Pin-like site-specific DNA recombinase